MPEQSKKNVAVWNWYQTKDSVTYLRIATDYRNPETKKQYYMIQEYRNNLIMEHGLTIAQAKNYILEFCIVR